jgi:outer membrane receptor protein involved in Fe transport
MTPAGNAGVINFRTKKSKTKGFNTSITLGGGIGKYPKANESINLNYRTGKVNLFGNYSYRYNKGYQSLDITPKIPGQCGRCAIHLQPAFGYVSRLPNSHF